MTTLQQKVLNSSSLLIATKMFQRSIGLISILILARVLTPEDFAIVALTAIVVHFFDMLSNVGSEQYIIQKNNVSAQDLNTAWTIDIILKSSLYVLLLLLSYLINGFYEDIDIQLPLIIGSSILIINAFKNPGILILKKELSYKNIFWLSVVQKFLSFIAVMIAAFTLRSYWALIIGDIIAALTFTIGSYFLYNYRPQLSLKCIKKQWNFSQWLLLKGIIGYIRSQIDTLIVSSFFNANLLGKYYMSRNLAMLPGQNLLHPAIEPLLAAFSKSRKKTSKLEQHLRYSLFVVALFAIPITFYIWYFPKPIISTLLGEQWKDSYKLLSYMALLFLYYTFMLILEQALIALQQLKALLYFDICSLVLIGGSIFWACSYGIDIHHVALLRGGLGLLVTLASLFFVTYLIKLKLLELFKLIFPLIIFSLISIHFTLNISFTSFETPLINLLWTGIFFCSTYILLCCLYAISFPRNNEINKTINLVKSILHRN